MLFFTPRARRWPLVFAVATLGACADDPAAPTAPLIPSKPRAALGDVFTVTNTSGGTGDGSLRWAVAQAAGGEIIRFDPALAGSAITLDTTLVISKGLTIEGPKDKGITISVGVKARVMYVEGSTPTTLRNLTITGGKIPTEAGGGILASGDVVLEHTTVRGNEAAAGGAIYGNGVTLTNSTVSGNISYPGFAAVMAAPLTLVNSTVAYNLNGGIERNSHTIVLRNSIIANNGSGQNCVAWGNITYEGKNLSDDASCGDASVMLIGDAKLEPLADNGGPSATHALASGSPALDAVATCTVTVDQRYVLRDDGKCDIGAYERFTPTAVTLTVDPSAAVNPTTGWAVVTGTLRCSRDEQFELAVSLKQNQKSVRAATVVQAAGSLAVACGRTIKPWSLVLVPSSGGFVNGGAEAAAQTANTGQGTTPSALTTPVKLYWGHK